MEKKIIDLEIVDELEGSGVDAIALVDSPAIEKNFMYFKAEQFVEPKSGESQSDYMGRCVPVLIGEGKDQDQAVAICISTYENMGKVELAKVSFDFDDTLSTNAGLQLAMKYRRNGDTLYIISARSGVGPDMLERALKLGIPRDRIFATGSNLAKVAKVRELGIVKHIDNNADVIRNLSGIGQKFEIDTAGLAPYTNQTGPLKRKAVLAEEDLNIDVFGYATRYFYICPGAIATFKHLAEMNPDEDTIGMIRAAALEADAIFLIEKEVKEAGIATQDQVNAVKLLVDDFKDVMNEIDARVGMVHDVSYMDEHVATVESYLQSAEEFAETYTDYPKEAVENARRALAYAEENGWGDCGMATGKARANQLANEEPISEDTIARMASFERHRQNSETPYGEGCGKLMWDAWGGDAGIEWAQRKLKQIRGEEFATVEELAVGDAVSWKTADQNPRGRIREIVRGSKKVPGADFEIKGTEEDPGYLIEIYEEVDGKWEPTGKYVGRKADSILKNVELAETDRTVGTYGYSKLMFADESKKELVGPVAIPDMEIPRKDKEGNIYFVRFSKDVVKKMAEKFMREQRLSENNIQHKDDINAGSYVFESWVVETPEDKANTVYGLDVPVGTWMVKMRVVNLETWAKVKSGELRGFSLQGNFLSQDEYEAYVKDKKMYEDLLSFVSSI